MTVVPASDVIRFRRATVKSLFEVGLPTGDVAFTVNGRSALALALRAMGVGHGERVLLPDYICRSVISALNCVGALPCFYRIDRELRPDLDDFERKLREVRVAIAVHYLGWRLADFDELLALAEEREVSVIEDCAHGLFAMHGGRPLGSEGHAAIFSFRKTIAIPNGGAVVMQQGPAVGPKTPRFQLAELFGLVRECLFRIERAIGIPIRMRLLAVPGVLDRLYDRDDGIMPEPLETMGLLSASILRRQHPEEASIRRRNFLELGRMLAHRPGGISLLMEDLPDGACPVGYPILVADRDGVRAHLYRRGIGTRTFWDRLPMELRSDDHEDAFFLSSRLLLLPVHSGLKASDLGQVERALER